MKSDEAATRHAIYGHVVHAHYPLRALRPSDAVEGPLGKIVLQAGEVPLHLEDARLKRHGVEVSPTAVLLKPHEAGRPLGRVLIRDGREIIVAAEAGAERELEAFILGSGLGSICLQKGLLPLHASAACLDGKALAFAGASGAGKSTMAAALAAQGHAHVSDDVSVIRFRPDGRAMVYPGTHMMKLAPDSSGALGVEIARAEGRPGPRGKSHFRNDPAVEIDGERELAAVYILDLSDDPQIAIERIAGVQAVATLAAQVYRRGWLRPMGIAETRLKDIVQLAQHVPCFRLRRPHRFDLLPEVVEAVQRHRETLS